MGERVLAPGEFPWPTQIEWPHSDGPHVRVATLCDDVIEEINESVSVFRMLNRLVIRGNPSFPISIPTTLFIALEGFSKDRTDHQITISVASPIGPQVLNETVDVKPFGPFEEFHLRLLFRFPVVDLGQHAIAIIYEGRMLSVLRVSVEIDAEHESEAAHRPLFSQLEETSYSTSGEETRRRRSTLPGVVEETSE